MNKFNLKPRKMNWKRLCAEKEADILALRNQVDYLIRTIRDTDDIIFSMGQYANGTWNESVRIRFAQLYEGMMARKHAESMSIGRVIEDRLHEVYKEESMALKQITKGK